MGMALGNPTILLLPLLVLLCHPVSPAVRMKRLAEEAAKKDKMLGDLQLSLTENVFIPFMEGVIDHIEDAGGEVVYTTASGRRVRRRSVEAEETVYQNHEAHGLVSVAELRARTNEVSDVFEMVIERL